MTYRLSLLLVFFIYCATPRNINDNQTHHFPATTEKATVLPPKENFYIFLMAGQSNMAGRGFVEPGDTISTTRILTLNKNNEWVYAKEPLHYYEPGRTGLDCGLSFAKKLARKYKKANNYRVSALCYRRKFYRAMARRLHLQGRNSLF
jgi:hypothetical protein